MNEIKSNNAESNQSAHSDLEQAGTEETGGENQAGFSPTKSFFPKVTGNNSVTLNRENVMRLQPLIGNQAVMRLIAAKKQAAPAPVPPSVSPKTIQRKVQVDLDQFKGLSHLGNQLQNSTFVQIKAAYKAYLKTNDPAKETKLVTELLKLCDKWMLRHAALKDKKDPKKLDVITKLKLAIAEEAASKKPLNTGKQVTFDPNVATIVPSQTASTTSPNPIPTPANNGGGGADLGDDTRILDIDVDSGGDDSRLLDDTVNTSNQVQGGGNLSNVLGYRDDDVNGVGTQNQPQSVAQNQGQPQNQGQVQGGVALPGDLGVRDDSNIAGNTANNQNQNQGGEVQDQPVQDVGPRAELINRIGLPPAYINGLSQPDFDLLVTADKALDDGDVVEADKSFSTLRTSLGGVVNMLKGFLMRYHMGNIHPELSKMMDDPTFVVPGDKAVKAQDQVSGLAKKFHDDTKTAGKKPDNRYLDIAKTVGQMQNNSQDEFGTLTIQEATALVGYLSDLYPNYNNPLRMGIGQTAGPNAFGEENLNLTATAISALNKMTPYAGKVFRHSGVFPGYLEMHQAGAVIPDLAFMSSAKTQHGTQGGLNHDSLEVILDTRSGKDMEEAAWFGGESEILFKPGTRFRVLVRLDLTSMPGGKWPTEADATSQGWGPNELELIKYLHADNEKDKIKHLILKKEA